MVPPKQPRGVGEVVLWSAGVALLAFCCCCSTDALLAQRDGKRLLQTLHQASTGGSEGVRSPTPGAVEAELTIQSIGLATPVLTGCTDATLRRGACRLLGTAVAGGLGNMAVAGHRDTRFRALQGLKIGAVIDVADPSGHYEYVVDRVEIVAPEDVQVLDIGDRPELTLITCFPFNYIGAAPKRFIAHAYLRSVDGSAL